MPMVAGYDISYGMSFLQSSIDVEQLAAWGIRRGVIQAIERRVALGRDKAVTPVSKDRFERILRDGAQGYPAEIRDRLERVRFDSQGQLSARARRRGIETVGSVGSQSVLNTRHVPLDESAAAYKDIDQVIDSIAGAGLARVVAICRPMAVIKGA